MIENQTSHSGAGRKRLARLLTALVSVLLLGLSVYASRETARPVGAVAAGEDKAAASAVAKANAFLEALDAQQRAKVLYEYDSAKKPSWSNLPVTMVPRNGLPLGELTKAQRAAALEAVAAVLSKQGYQKVVDIMNADDQLVKGKENKMRFGTEHFYLAMFGKPSPTQPWMLQFGGHHLGINVTMVGKNAVLTPTHTGTQPDVFTRAGKTVRPLGRKTTWHSNWSTCSTPNNASKPCSAKNRRTSCLVPVKTARRSHQKDSRAPRSTKPSRPRSWS